MLKIFRGANLLKKITGLTVFIFLLIYIFSSVNEVFANVGITQATGGTNISADKAANAVSPAYTTLTNIVITSGAQNDFAKNAANRTLILTAPTGWTFNVGVGTGSVSGTGITYNSIAVTASTITFAYTRSSANSSNAAITISGIQVRSTNGATLPNSGNILRTVANPGTGTIAGITNGTTVFGQLSQAVGAKNRLAFTTQPSATALVSTDFATKPVVTVQDQFANTVTSDNVAVTRSAVLSSGICGGTAGNGTLFSTPLSGANATSGVMTYTAMQYSVAESIKICAVSGAVSTTSSAISVQNPVPTTTSISPTSKNVGDSQFSLIVNGTNFNSSSTVYFNGSARVTAFSSSTQISATILSTDLLVATTTAQITVVNPAPGGGTSNAQTFTVGKANQTITFNALSNKVYGDADFGVSATSTSGLSVTFSASGTCSVLTSTVHIVSVGTCTITASQAGNANYNAATPVNQSFNITAKPITVTANSGQTKVFGAVDPAFTYTSSDLSATFTGALARAAGESVGTYAINIGNLSAGANYSISFVPANFAIVNPSPTTTSISPSSKTVGDAQFTLTINGTNFVSTSVVQVGGSNRTTTYSSSTVLTATIPASDLLASTTLAITVVSSAPGGGTSNSQVLSVSPIPATKFVITSATNGTIDLPSYVTIQVEDSSNNLITNYQRDVTLVASGGATGGGLIDIVNGVGTTSVYSSVVQSVHLSLFDSETTGLNVSSNRDVSFGPGDTAILSISATTTQMIAGTRLPITISRQDRLNNFVSAGSETFYLYRNSLSPVNNFYDSATNGNVLDSVMVPNNSSSATVWYYDEHVGTPNITVSDNSHAPDGTTGIDDASIGATVTSAPASTLHLNSPGDLTAGGRLHYQVSRQDQFGNSSDNGSTTIYLYNSPFATSTVFYDAGSLGNVITSLVMSPGISTSDFWLYAEKAENLSVTVSDNSHAPDSSGIVDATDNITVNPGPAAIFTLNEPGNMTIGTRLGYFVSRFDLFNNPVSSGDSTVYFYSDPSGSSTVFYNTASDGETINSLIISAGTLFKNFWFYSGDVGNYNITASDNSHAPDSAGVVDATDAVTVSPVPIVATHFIIDDTATTTVGATAHITVRAKDDAGNLDTSYNNSVVLHADGSATPGGIVPISGGVGSINIIDTKAEIVNLTLENTASSSLDVSSRKTINFIAGPTKKFIMTGVASAQAGERISYTINRKDTYDNTVTSGTDPIYLYSNAAIGTAHFYNEPSGGIQITSTSIPEGSDSVVVWFAGTLAGSWTNYVSDNHSSVDGDTGIIDGISAININPGPTSRIFLNDPGDMTAGTRLGYTATRYDAYNNEVTSGSAGFYLYSNSGASTAFYSSDVGGSPMSLLHFTDGQSTANFWYYVNSLGIWTVYVSDNSHAPDSSGIVDGQDGVTVSAAPIVATKFLIETSNDSALVGDSVDVTIRAVDDNNNIQTTYEHDVTLHASGDATGEGLINISNGVGHATVSDATEETVTLTLSDTQSTHLNVSSSQTIVFSKIVTTIHHISSTETNATISPNVSFTGRAFPSANFEIMAIQNGQVPVGGGSSGASTGNFNVQYSGVLPATADSFVLVVYDKDHNIAQTKIFKLGVNDQLAKNILMAPTVSLMAQSVVKGSFLGIEGSAMPSYKIQLAVDGIKAAETTTAGADGSYALTFNTYRLAIGEHTLRARQVDSQGVASDYSIEKTFLITKKYVSKADLNGDGVVDIQDWSIFVARYKSTDINTRQSVDLNNDGKVDNTDLSLFIEALTH